MTQQASKQNPKIDWGYYAVTPRMVRTHYKQLSHTEKWLYVCLKDLCGDKGTCFRSLRTLAEETDLSIGNLSTGIRHLHDAGLIHAEKKRRSANPTAKEVWHLSIVDIWQANAEYCSKFEQERQNVQNLNNTVQGLNNNVQILNEVSPQCSKNEQQCSFFETEVITMKDNITEERTDEEERDSTHPPFSQDATALAMHTPVFAMEDEEKVTQALPPSLSSEQQEEQGDAAATSPQSKEQPHEREIPPVAPVVAEPLEQLPAQVVPLPPVVVESVGVPLTAQPTPSACGTQADMTQVPSLSSKPSRKPKMPKDGVPAPERIEAVFVCMEATIRRLTKQEDFTFGRTKKAREAIRDLLSGRSVSQEKMDWHIARLWNKPKDSKTGFYWRENLSVVAICNNYDREIVNYKPPLHVVAPTPTPTQEPPVDKSKIFSMKPLFHLAPKPPLRRRFTEREEVAR